MFNKQLDQGFIPDNISQISKNSLAQPQSADEITELQHNLHGRIQGPAYTHEVFRKRQSYLMSSSQQRVFQYTHNQSIKQDPNEQISDKDKSRITNQASFIGEEEDQYVKKLQHARSQISQQEQQIMSHISKHLDQMDHSNRQDRHLIPATLQKQNTQQQYQQNSQRIDHNVFFPPSNFQINDPYAYKRQPSETDTETHSFSSNRQLQIFQHKKSSNLNFISSQIKELLSYNKFMLLQVQKLQTKRTMAQTLIQIRRLKIGMRNHQYTKNINYTFPIKKHNDKLSVKTPKPIDESQMTYYANLKQKIEKQREEFNHFQEKYNLLNGYCQMLIKNPNYSKSPIEDAQSKLLKLSKSSSKISTIRSLPKSPHKRFSNANIMKSQKSIPSTKNISDSFYKIAQTSQIFNKQNKKADRKKAYQILQIKQQTIKQNISQFSNFCQNKSKRLQLQSDILRKQLQIVNEHIIDCCKQKMLWDQRIKYAKGHNTSPKLNSKVDFRSQSRLGSPQNFQYSLRNDNKSRYQSPLLMTFKPTKSNQKNFIQRNKLIAKNMSKTKLAQNIRNSSSKSKDISSAKLLNTSRNKVHKIKSFTNIHQHSINSSRQKTFKKPTIQTLQSLQKIPLPNYEYFGEPL